LFTKKIVLRRHKKTAYNSLLEILGDRFRSFLQMMLENPLFYTEIQRRDFGGNFTSAQ
jgi:hypothetical protein